MNWLNPMSSSLQANRENVTWVFHKGKYKLQKQTTSPQCALSFAIKQSMRTWYKLTQGNHKECSNNHWHLSSQTLIPDCLYYPGQKFIFLSFSSKKGAFIHIFEQYKYYIWWLRAQGLFPLYLCSPKVSFHLINYPGAALCFFISDFLEQ